ncbi:hypothetical protein MMC16_005178 [Acarospora aff. strigata]|nr:hypothetical protein [Acarospora aff. strigata]
MLKHKCAKASRRSSLWDRDYPVNQHRPSWGWRLSSSWDKHGGRWVDVDKLLKKTETEGQRLDSWYADFHTRQGRFRRRMMEIRRSVDEDPFKAIFGSTVERASTDWSPLTWGLARKAEKETRTDEGVPTVDPSHSKPKEKLQDVAKFSKQVDGQKSNPHNHQNLGPLRSGTTRAQATSSTEPTVSNIIADSSVNAPASPSPVNGEFMIDPITLRKVPRIASSATKPIQAGRQSNNEVINIPVKKSPGYNAQTSDVKKHTEADSTQDVLEIELSKYKAPSVNAEKSCAHEAPSDPVAKGLEDYEHLVAGTSATPEFCQSMENSPAQEIFGNGPRTKEWLARDSARSEDSASKTRITTRQIESSLCRRLRDGAHPGSKLKPEEPRELHYNEGEPTIEDIDLLRASDVRASSGLAGRPWKETDEDKQRRRKKLEDDFNKPQGLETQYTEELAAQAVANRKSTASQVQREDKYNPIPQVSERPYLDGVKPQSLTIQGSDAFGYDLTPQGLETSYEQEVQNRAETLENLYAVEVERQEAALRDAEIGGYDRTPQGLETTFAREQGRLVQIGESIELNQKTQIYQHSPASEEQQIRGEGDMSANVHEFSARNRWYKRNAPHATKKAVNSACEVFPAGEVLPNMVFDADGQDAGVESGLGAYDRKHGRQTYTFQTGQDSLEADILAQLENQTTKNIPDQGPTHAGSYSSPEVLAMRWEEEEQKLHEELRETNDILSEAQAEITKFTACKETSSSVKTEGQKASEAKGAPLSSQESPPSEVSLPIGPHTTASELERPIPTAAAAAPVTYKILAYDTSARDVISVTTTSSTISPNETPLSLAETISRLTNPAKFLAHFPSLQASGYEVVSGSSDVLVFKRVRDGDAQDHVPASITEFARLRYRRPMNPIDGTTTQTGNFASPTGFVNYDVVLPLPPSEEAPPQPRPASAQTSGKVRREEEVFSGSSRRWDDEKVRPEKPKGRAQKAARRVFWVGAWTAGCCYAVGVVAEFFRSGGADGLGPQGF